eukprot:GHVQ01002149.1.p1 GENE.GHVQ01002149.1~~GHVQ01002149.1.p1  ORF type:complete len:398 (-),score=61.41 GHVQ01002149.1:25-1218(-)
MSPPLPFAVTVPVDGGGEEGGGVCCSDQDVLMGGEKGGVGGGVREGGAWTRMVLVEDQTSNVFYHAVPSYLEGDKSYLQNPSTSYWDFLSILCLFSLLFSLRWFLFGINFASFRRVGLVGELVSRGKTHAKFIKPRKLQQFLENLWYLSWHLFSCSACSYVLYLEARPPLFDGWFAEALRTSRGRWYFVATEAEVLQGGMGTYGWPMLPMMDVCKLFYLTEIGFWSSCVGYLYLETQRSDIVAMCVHHAATLVALVMSYVCCYWRIGLVVLLVHDIVDVFLYCAKTMHCTYIYTRCVEGMFGLFALSYFLLRIVVFTWQCVWPACNIWDIRKATGGLIQSHMDAPGGLLLPGALVLLLLLHVFWYSIIIKMLWTSVTAHKQITDIGDPRESSDDEST